MNSLLDQHEMGSLLGQALMPPSDLLSDAMAVPGVQHQDAPLASNNAPRSQRDSANPILANNYHSNEDPTSMLNEDMQRTQLGETGGGP